MNPSLTALYWTLLCGVVTPGGVLFVVGLNRSQVRHRYPLPRGVMRRFMAAVAHYGVPPTFLRTAACLTMGGAPHAAVSSAHRSTRPLKTVLPPEHAAGEPLRDATNTPTWEEVKNVVVEKCESGYRQAVQMKSAPAMKELFKIFGFDHLPDSTLSALADEVLKEA